MKALGIVRSNCLELVDVEIQEGAILPGNCPGNLGRTCNDCGFLVRTEHGSDAEAPLPSGPAANKRQSVTFLLCRWHEQEALLA